MCWAMLSLAFEMYCIRIALLLFLWLWSDGTCLSLQSSRVRYDELNRLGSFCWLAFDGLMLLCGFRVWCCTSSLLWGFGSCCACIDFAIVFFITVSWMKSPKHTLSREKSTVLAHNSRLSNEEQTVICTFAPLFKAFPSPSHLRNLERDCQITFLSDVHSEANVHTTTR